MLEDTRRFICQNDFYTRMGVGRAGLEPTTLCTSRDLIEGLKDEERNIMVSEVLSKLQPLKKEKGSA
jgi:hypothetical protein